MAEPLTVSDAPPTGVRRPAAWSPLMTALVVVVVGVAGVLALLQEPPSAPPDPSRFVGDGYAIRIPPEYEMEKDPELDSWLSPDGTRALRAFPIAVHEASDHDEALQLAADEMVVLLRQLGLTVTDAPRPVTLPAGPARLIEFSVNDGQRLTGVVLADRPRAWIFIVMGFEADPERATLESIELNPSGESE